MANFILLGAVLLLSLSCNQSDCQSQTSPEKSETTLAACPAPDPDPIPDEPGEDHGEVPHEALIFDINAELNNFEPEDEAKVQKAFEIIKKVVASREFRNRVLNYEYQGSKQFHDNKSMSNEQIYQTILNGSEDLLPETDHQMDLELELYYSWRSTVGYTYPSALRIYMNTKFFDNYTPSQVANNVFHEWTHKLGFSHDSSYSVSRDSSVPYAIGDIIEELGKQFE